MAQRGGLPSIAHVGHRRLAAHEWRRKAPPHGLGEALAVADAEMPPSFKWPDFKEGVAHFLEKRAPKFANI